jgi:hypothetical protein
VEKICISKLGSSKHQFLGVNPENDYENINEPEIKTELRNGSEMISFTEWITGQYKYSWFTKVISGIATIHWMFGLEL